MEGESPLLKEGGNAAKPLLTRFCVAKSVISPSKPPSLTENFPTEPRCYRSENLFRFCGGGGSVGKFFCRIGRCGIFCSVRLSHSFCGWEISTKRIQRTNRVRSRTVKKTPPAKSKNFPQEHPPKQGETNYRNAAAGALGGSSGRMREVWREKGHPPKGGPFSLQGLLHPIRPSTKRSRKTLTERTERKTKRTAKASGKRVAIRGVSAGLRR